MEKTSKFIYFVVCYAFFIFADLYMSSILVDKITHGFRMSNPVFSLNYVKNTGAAFSILQNSRELLIILSMIALVLLALHVINNLKSISLKTCFFIALLSAGIAGNLLLPGTAGHPRRPSIDGCSPRPVRRFMR